jgi:serine/threonine-protein kinase
MTLAPGTRLGPYEIASLLGAGGMGEVYEARDTRLGRSVAVKVLPAELAADAGRRERFEREARVISSLSHPHICTLHDVGREGDVHYLVMERLEGVTLADRLEKGALPIEACLRHGIEIAEGLHEAHRRGIVHRDLKPGNVMLTKTGAKLLDFGLAKPGGGLLAAAGPGAVSAPTQQKPLTAEGSLLGTFQYMAPEQLEGREGDARSDVWALGLVLYEMVSGKRPFGGQSPASLIAAILQSEPQPLAALQPVVPAGLDRVVKACLAKDPEARWQSARDLATELGWIAEGSAAGTPATGRKRSSIARTAVLVSLVALAAGLLGYRWNRTSPAPARPVMRLAVVPAADEGLGLGRGSAVAVSPDGERLVYLVGSGSSRRLVSRALAQAESTPLAGAEGADAPFFSPDGQWVAFFASGKLKKVPAAGGPPQTLCDAPDARGGSWGVDDTIVFTPGNFAGLVRVAANGGTPQALTTPDADAGERTHRWPQVLPGGKQALFTIGLAGGTSFDEAGIGIVDLATGARRVLSERGFYARYVPTGHLVFLRGATLLAAPFDLRRLELAGPPVPLVEGVRTNASGGGHFAFSETGTLVHVQGSALETDRALVWVDRKGNLTPAADTRRDYLYPRVSPDGGRIAFSARAGTPDVWVQDIARGTFTRLAASPGARTMPAWSPDGHRIAYWSGEPGRPRTLLAKPSDGTGMEEALVTAPSNGLTASWSPDGRSLAYDVHDAKDGWDVWVITLAGDRTPRPFLRTPANEQAAAFSPDGRHLAYHSDVSGSREVYVQAFDGASGRVQISNQGGEYPVWGRDGRELFYRSGDRMMAVDVKGGGAIHVGAPRLVFERHLLEGIYDVHPDGRFLMVEVDYGRPPRELTFVLEWFAELRARVPRG